MLLNKTKLRVLLGLITFSYHAFAIDNSSETSSDKAENTVERIEVEGQNPNFYLEQFRKERDAFYEHYNALVGEDSDLRIRCGKRKPEWAPTKLRKKDYCEPVFVYTLERKTTQTNLDFANIRGRNPLDGFASNPAKVTYNLKKQQMAEVLKKLISEHSDLRAKYQNFTEAETEYRANQ